MAEMTVGPELETVLGPKEVLRLWEVVLRDISIKLIYHNIVDHTPAKGRGQTIHVEGPLW